jgi:hypothetical protein
MSFIRLDMRGGAGNHPTMFDEAYIEVAASLQTEVF